VRIFLDTGVDGLSIEVFVGIAELFGHKILLLTELKVIIHLLELIHKVIYLLFPLHLQTLAAIWDRTAQDQVSKLLNHKELLQNRVQIASCPQISKAHEL
jgi:hypothetical protein